ncbi:uncharacterized protein LOC143292567 [Babylonia areolata]|uniref:uncharacterized protein LOC143292567 n=1 Tax=Babylonia areolata TaxID=304850 RepID=UPI003FCF9EB7
MHIIGWINLTIVLAIVAGLLQLAGYVAPMWIWLDVDSFRVGIGLWFTTGCGAEQGTCTYVPDVSFGFTTDDTWSKPMFNAVRGLETAAVGVWVILMLFLAVYRFGFAAKWASMLQLNIAAFVAAILVWLCILGGLIVYCAGFWPVVGTSHSVSTASFPWSLVMCLFSAFLFIVVTVLIRVKCRERSQLKHAIPISGDPMMEQFPHTKHGLIHRYFSPMYRGNNRAIGYQSEGGNVVNNLNTRLVDAEEHNQVAAIDNVAFDDTRTSDNNYRYLPTTTAANTTAYNGHAQNGYGYGVTSSAQDYQSETVIRRSLPTAIVTYNADGEATDVQRLYLQNGAAQLDRRLDDADALARGYHQQQAGGVTTTTTTNVSTFNQTRGAENEGFRSYHTGGAVTRGSATGTHQHSLMNDTTAATTARELTSRHHASGNRELSTHVTGNDVVAGAVYYQGDGGTRDATSGNVRMGERVITKTTTTTYVTEEGHERRGGGLKVTDLQSNDGALKPRQYDYSTWTSGDSVRPYDPTYIYRPYSETVNPAADNNTL